MAATSIAAPKWEMRVVFPSLESDEFNQAFRSLLDSGITLERQFDTVGVGSDGPAPEESKVVEILEAWNALSEQAQPVRAFIYSFVTTDATNELAQKKLSELQPFSANMMKLWGRLNAWVGRLDSVSHPALLDHKYFLSRAKTVATHQMSAAEEALAADLTLTGSTAWGRLHGDVTSQIQVRVPFPSGEETLPMAVVRGMAYDADATTRRVAYEAEIARWKEFQEPLAAAMNAIKGEVGLLAKRRGWDSALHHAVFEANIDMKTLDAMMGAAREAFPVLRRYLKAKARLVSGQNHLPWYDLFAPAGSESRTWAYDEGAAFVAEQFHRYSEKMGSFAERSFRENWIDAQPSPGKRDGAFCMGLRADESRILMTWKPSFGSVSTLAHELGHAYHNLCLFGRTDLQKETPMTLAETASIFCEQIISQAALADANDAERLVILEQSLQRATQTVVDISSRFLFEREVFERREQATLSANELCDLMLWAQSETYGDGLSDARHAYMWAVKPHYYSGGSSFYNFPYMFGLLFSLGLYAQYQQDPEPFKAKYDALLSSTGLDDAASLAAGFGIDITTPKFWESSLSTIAQDVAAFEKLATAAN